MGNASNQGQPPDNKAAPRSVLGSAVVLTPDGFADHQPAINADQNQLQDAAVHHQVEQAFDHDARRRAEMPVVIIGQRDHEQREGEAAQEVSQRQVEEPDGGDATWHTEACHPNHHGVPRNPHHHHQCIEEESCVLGWLHLWSQIARKVGQYIISPVN